MATIRRPGGSGHAAAAASLPRSLSETRPKVPEAQNIDQDVVEGFGDEWSHFDQSRLDDEDRSNVFSDYFAIFPWEDLPPDAAGADIGCGSGRWAALVAPRVGTLHCVEPAELAMVVARRNLKDHANVRFHSAAANSIPLEDGSLDFAYSLGVLHHIPDTAGALAACVNKLKPGAPFLVYLYYALDNRPAWFRLVWRASDILRRIISNLPRPVARFVAGVLAVIIYWPLSRAALVGERLGLDVSSWPLAHYRHRRFYVLATDSLDRFGTRLEHRFTREQIERMMLSAGLRNIRFHDREPYWTAVGRKAS